MKAVIQRVTAGSVSIAGKNIARIDQGLVILLGVQIGDTSAEAKWLAEKCSHLRIFEDDGGKMNRSLLEIAGEALVVSQFTLLADSQKGRRPSYVSAAPPGEAEPLVEAFIEFMRSNGVPVQPGVFGANMQVEILNDGPVTILLERQPTGSLRAY